MTKQPRTTKDAADARKQRLAQALRANLHKRKSQARQRQEHVEEPDPQKRGTPGNRG